MELAKESDRSAVVLGGARLNVALERLLKAVMNHHPGGDDNLFDPDRPVGSFSSKIALAYRLGLIDKEMEFCLQMIRKTRNDFAHSIGRATLEASTHKSRISEVARIMQKHAQWDEFRPIFNETVSSSALGDFCTCLVSMIIGLEIAERFAQPINAAIKGTVR